MIRSTLAYLKARLNERSTWIAFGGAVTAAAAIPHPWNLVLFATGVIASLVPDGPLSQ